MKRSNSLFRLLFLLLGAAVTLAAVLNRQAIIDQITFWQFHPSSAVQQLDSEAGLNAHGTFLLYSAQASIKEKSQFGTLCRNSDPSTSVLGCYVNNRIYVYDVTDTRLEGIKAVTAAHEMLHAAYARLSNSEKNNVDSMIDAAYVKLQNQDGLKARMAIYAKTEPGQRDNELHSVMGTEIGDLPSDLEQYYQQYFTDRSKVVAAHAAYQSVFDSIQNKASQLAAELTTLKTEITAAKVQYNADASAAQMAISAFNTRANNSNGFSSEESFDSARAALSRQVNAVDNERSKLNDQIDEFNIKNQQLSALDTQAKNLNNSIDSSLPASPQL